MEFSDKKSKLTGTIREAFAAVAKKSAHVEINKAALQSYAEALPATKELSIYDTDHHFIGTDEETAAYVMVLDSINFGGPSKWDLKNEGLQLVDNSLYFTMSTRLKEIFETDGIIDADTLATLTKAECKKMLGLPAQGEASDWLAMMYTKSMNSLGRFISENHDGKFMNVITAADGSVENLVQDLAQLSTFNDAFYYKGTYVPFFKRAQITAADLHLAFSHMGKSLFNDIDNLTMFPDNAVAHTLHEDGILIYSDELEEKIRNGVTLEIGSEEEMEIRANTAHAIELMKQYRPDLSAMNIDHMLWHRSHEPIYLSKPHHKTRSPFY